MGFSLAAVGCGGSATDDPITILNDFRPNMDAGRQMYRGKTVRRRLEKVSSATESLGNVSVEGRVGKITIRAVVSDAAEKTKALALKAGEPATLEGEVIDATGDLPTMGVIFLKSAKVVP